MIGTIDDLIEALGGVAKVATLCGVGPSAVSNWRSRGRIPTEKFMMLADALRRAGKGEAAPALFGFEPTEARP